MADKPLGRLITDRPSELMRVKQGQYLLVNAIAKRVRNIQKAAAPGANLINPDPLKDALIEFATDDIRIHEVEDDEPAAAEEE